MSYFKIFVDNRPRTFMWAVDSFDARYRYAKEAGIDIKRVYAQDTCDQNWY